MVNLFYKKMDGPLDDRRGFTIQSLNTATNPCHGNQPVPRQPTRATATNPRDHDELDFLLTPAQSQWSAPPR